MKNMGIIAIVVALVAVMSVELFRGYVTRDSMSRVQEWVVAGVAAAIILGIGAKTFWRSSKR